MNRKGQWALVNHPYFGSLWLFDAEVVDGHVVGLVDSGSWDEPPELLNFPLSCVRKWAPPLTEGLE